MRLLEAHIDGFGQLSNRRIKFDAPVIVVFGPNEAGKSTIFGFVKSMLYGFARRNQPAERMEPAMGGRHGGRLIFADADGTLYALERYGDKAGGKPLVRRLEEVSETTGGNGLDTPMEQAAFEKRFLGGVNERLFKQLFAITLTELREASVLSGEELSRYLYQAGWEEGRTVAAAEKQIAAELDSLFKPRGSGQKLALGAKAIETLDGELRTLGDGISEYNALLADNEATAEQLALLELQLEVTAEKSRLLRKAIAARPMWLRRKFLLAERGSIAYAGELPAGTDLEWMSLEQAKRDNHALLTRLQIDKAALEAERALFQFDPQLLALEEETEGLLHSAERMLDLRKQHEEWEKELRLLDESIGTMMAAISPHWTERQLRQLAVTVADRDYVRDYRDRLSTGKQLEDRLSGETEMLESQLREQAGRLDAEEDKLRKTLLMRSEGEGHFAIKPLAAPELTRAWNRLDEALRRCDLARARGEAGGQGEGSSILPVRSKKEKKSAGLILWCAAGLALLLGLAAASGFAGEFAFAAWLSAAMLAGASASVLIVNRSGDGASRRKGAVTPRSATDGDFNRCADEVRRGLAELLERPGRLAEQLIGGHEADEAASLRLRSDLKTTVRERMDKLAEAERIGSAIEESKRRRDAISKQMQERSAKLETLREELSAGKRVWEEWLSERTLPVSLSPLAALETFDLAEAALKRLREYDRLGERISSASKELASYTAAVSSICSVWPESRLHADKEPSVSLKLLHGEIRRQAVLSAKAAELDARTRGLAAELEAASGMRDELDRQREALITGSGLAGEAAMAQAIQDGLKLTELDDECLKLTIELEAGLPEGAISEMDALLEECDEEELKSRFDSEARRLEGLKDKQRELLEQRGKRIGELERLMQSERKQRLLEEREMAVSALEADMDRYGMLSTAKALIEATRRKYEKERQPAVLRNASAFMERLTDGKYRRVLAEPGRSSIELETMEYGRLDSSMLSRGTVEQLYLAMRLALAAEVSGGSDLPLLLDDLFVNFDRNRLRAAANLVSELSRTRQVLLFTCHEHVRDELVRANPGAVMLAADAWAEGAVHFLGESTSPESKGVI